MSHMLELDKKYLASTVNKLTIYAVSYVFTFGNFDGLSNLMVLRFVNDEDIILNSNLLSSPSLRSSPNLFSNSKDESLNKTLRSIPDRLPPLSCKSKYSYLLNDWLFLLSGEIKNAVFSPKGVQTS